MRQIFTLIFLLFNVALLYGQNRAIRIDFMTGIHKPTSSLDIENKLGLRVGGGVRYRLKNKSSFNIIQINYDFFPKAKNVTAVDQKENGPSSNTISFLTGYSYPIFNHVYLGGNTGVGLVGNNRTDRTTKFGVNPFISFEPFREVYVDFGYLNFWGGYKNTSYFNFNLRYSF